MIPLITAALAGAFGALFGLSYKLKERQVLATDPLLALFAVLYTAFSALLLVVFRERPYSAAALWLGVLFGLSMYGAIRLFYGLITRSQLNISWLILQFSIVFPFGLSTLFYREKLALAGAAGVALMFVSIVFFALGRGRPGSAAPIPDRRAALLLALSTALTGVAISVPRVYAAVDPAGGTFALLLYQGLTASAVALAVVLFRHLLRRALRPAQLLPRADPRAPVTPARPPGPRRGGLLPLALYMSLTNSLSAAFLVVATKSLPGAIVYPVRGVMNVLVVFVMSFLLFRERVRPLEAVGSLVALAGIVLVAMTLG
jgi:drug/metabolite transporter (DMT)-like permease